jgi:hypothetical protein
MTVADPERTGVVCPAAGGQPGRGKRASSSHLNELRMQWIVISNFGAFTFRPDAAVGSWTDGDGRYDDRLYLLILDVDDTAEHRAWIGHLKSHLLRRFRQLEIYVTSYLVEVH